MEIERKFLIMGSVEAWKKYPCKHMEQGYLCTKGSTLRIRKAEDICYLTLKRNKAVEGAEAGAIVNHEVEEEIPLSSYEYLKNKVDGNMVTKTRYYIPYEAHTIELDVFEGGLEGLVVAEIEYTDTCDAKATKVPEWFGPEVSFDKRFRNSHLSRIGSLAELFREER